ncbi:MAG: hypothetical protein EOP47_04730 [Sphingobacteriaceae bacterium]|nr:MAG: hypothetical protein EOP47_04730 [Sphingobacteriaceae bacterium]
MKKFMLLLLFALSIIACSRKPEALEYGKDACVHCRMTLMDSKFGAEIVTSKGKVHKFDSAECMLDYIGENHGKFGDSDTYMVANYHAQGTLIDARKCAYVHDKKINSPMGGNLAAMALQDAKTYIARGNGKLLTWDEVNR